MSTDAEHDPQDRAALPLPRWWAYYATVISAIAVVGLVLGVAGIYANNRQDAVYAAENKARDEQNKALLDCFDEFASQLAGGLPPVRKATAARDEASGARDDALQLVVNLAIRNAVDPPADPTGSQQEALDAVRVLQGAGEVLDRAQDRLARVRRENPYPDPPSTFCATR